MKAARPRARFFSRSRRSRRQRSCYGLIGASGAERGVTMPGLLDLIQQLSGRPDPTQQLIAAYGPAGNMASPGAGPAPPGGPQGPAGAGGAPGGPQQPPPQPQAFQSPPDLAQLNAKLAQGPQQPQQPPPPDLMQLYGQMVQRSQASEMFNRGAGLLAASAYPGRRPDIVMQGMTGGQMDPGALVNSIMSIQNFQRQQQQYQALQRAAPDIARQLGITPDEAMAAGPQAIQTALQMNMPTEATRNYLQARNVMRQQGMSEDDINLNMPPTMLAGAGMGDLGQRQFLSGQAQAIQANRQNGTPIPPQFTGDYTHYQTTMQAQGKLQADQANDLAESQAKFSAQFTVQQDIDNRINAIKNATEADGKTPVLQSILNSPLKKAAAMGLMNADAGTGFVSGLWGQGTQAAAGLTPEERSTIENMRQLGSNVYGQAFTSTGSRRTQPEVANITAGLSQVGRLNQPYGSYMDALNNFQKLNQAGMANAYGAAQRLDEVPDNLKSLVNPIYLPAQTDAKGHQVRPAGPLYTGAGGAWATRASAPQPQQPPASASTIAAPGGGGRAAGGADLSGMSDADANAAYDKLPSGTVFVGPDGKPHRKP
jgi:hypothetical protein